MLCICFLSSIIILIFACVVDIYKKFCPFLLLSSIPLYAYAAVLFIHPPAEEHVGCFLDWAFANKATVSICVQVFVWIYLFFSQVNIGCYPKMYWYAHTLNDYEGSVY